MILDRLDDLFDVMNFRLVDFLLDDFFLFDDGLLVVDMHRLHQRVRVLLLFHFDGDVDDDFAMASTESCEEI